LLSTVDVYDGTVDFLRSLDLTDEELSKTIVGTIGDIDGTHVCFDSIMITRLSALHTHH
jgi:hypothetical protein